MRNAELHHREGQLENQVATLDKSLRDAQAQSDTLTSKLDAAIEDANQQKGARSLLANQVQELTNDKTDAIASHAVLRNECHLYQKEYNRIIEAEKSQQSQIKERDTQLKNRTFEVSQKTTELTQIQQKIEHLRLLVVENSLGKSPFKSDVPGLQQLEDIVRRKVLDQNSIFDRLKKQESMLQQQLLNKNNDIESLRQAKVSDKAVSDRNINGVQQRLKASEAALDKTKQELSRLQE